MLVAIRDAESRTRFCGYRVEHYKLFVWTVSAVLAGIGGALFVPQVGIINPSEFSPANSIEAVIWVAVGGRGTLWGAVVGAVGVNAGKSWLTGAFPEIWLFALGALFVVVTLFLPKGIAGTLAADRWRGAERRHPAGPRDAGASARAAGRRHAGTAHRSSISTASTVSFDGFKALNASSWSSSRARCGPSSARTVPARRR